VLGIALPSGSFFTTLLALVRGLAGAHLPTLAVGLAAIAVLVG
jgi:hypothetical protein